MRGAIGLMAVLFGVHAALGDSEYRGEASDLETGKPAYTEEHVERTGGGQVLGLSTLYRNPAGDSIARRSLEFRVSPFLPDYRMEDYRDGWLEGARPESGSVLVYCRKGPGKPIKEKRLVVPAPAVVDGGFSNLLRARWEELSAGKRVRFNVIVPARMDYYRFVAYEDKEASRSLKGLKVVVAEPESKVLRLLAPRLEFTFDEGTRRMRKYAGNSNISRGGGGSLKVRLDLPQGGP